MLHIVDDAVFIDTAYRKFETIKPGQSLYVYIGKQRKFKYIEKIPVEFLMIQELIDVLASGKHKAIVLHSLQIERLLGNIHRSSKVLWIGWGYDYYDRLLWRFYPQGIFLPKTSKLRKKPKGEFLFKNKLRHLKRWLQGHLGIDPLRRIDYFSPVLDIEYEMATNSNSWFKAEYIPWNYNDEKVTENLLSFGDERSCEPCHILVGNSATPTNNHAEIFEWLASQSDIEGRRIVVPLNYGCDHYRNKVLELGDELFGENFSPITEWMDHDEYFKILNQCEFVFMNHLRQQGMGNIFYMLKKGAKVFLNKRNPVYQWLIRQGASVSIIGDDSQSISESIFVPLCQEQRQRNQKTGYSIADNHPDYLRTSHLIQTILNE